MRPLPVSTCTFDFLATYLSLREVVHVKVIILQRMMEGSKKTFLDGYPLIHTMNSMVNGVIFYVG